MNTEVIPKEIVDLIKGGNAPQVDIVSDDGQNRMRPDVMNFLLLASMTSQLVKIRKYFDDRTPEGRLNDYTPTVTDVRREFKLPKPAQSLACLNDGPNPAGIWINEVDVTPHTIAVGEGFHVNFDTHAIYRFYLQCNPGLTANLRLGVQG